MLRLDVDYEKISTHVVCVENCSEVSEWPDRPIVNLDANFVIPNDQRNIDLSFPRLLLSRRFLESGERFGSLVNGDSIPDGSQNFRPYRRPDFSDEWDYLRKCWSLSRNGKEKIAQKILKSASDVYYGNDPLDSLSDWLFRFCTFVTNPGFEKLFQNNIFSITPHLERMLESKDFIDAYNAQSKRRGGKYFSIIKEFYSSYSEFSQVYFFVVRCMDIPPDHYVSSENFDSVRMFYGNAFEVFTSLIDLLAMLNNIMLGRRYDQFENLTMAQYKNLNKSKRFSPFSNNQNFMEICEEADNKLRNASHHGTIYFDKEMKIIRYGEGRGGSNSEINLSYTNYLEKCVKIYLQIIILCRLEMLIAHWMKMKIVC
ncbi:MAG: hypothetical protein AB7G39_08715 [Alphaproteobacteria bacterium]